MTIAKGWLWTCAVALAACAVAPSGPTSAGSSASVAGTRWIALEPEGADQRTIPRLEFVRGGRLTGFTGCNMLSGIWMTDGDELRVGALIMTKRLCLGPAGDMEKRFLAAVGHDARARREGDRLVFTSPAGARFEFRQAAAA